MLNRPPRHVGDPRVQQSALFWTGIVPQATSSQRDAMAKKKLGKKYACYQCECKFYDLKRPKPICPKCGANQNEAPKRARPALAKASPTTTAPTRLRSRRRRDEEDSNDPSASFSDDESETDSPLEDGLTMIDDEELLDSDSEDFSEEE
jgi:hypothetical protein